MSRETDRAYYTRRAAEEHNRAAMARDVSAELVHRELAGEYERLIQRMALRRLA